jgi:hypothetical protein
MRVSNKSTCKTSCTHSLIFPPLILVFGPEGAFPKPNTEHHKPVYSNNA